MLRSFEEVGGGELLIRNLLEKIKITKLSRRREENRIKTIRYKDVLERSPHPD